MFRLYRETPEEKLDKNTIKKMLKWEPLQSVFVVEELDREDYMEYSLESGHTSHGTYRRHR
jgi:hypothetical protein